MSLTTIRSREISKLLAAYMYAEYTSRYLKLKLKMVTFPSPKVFVTVSENAH